MIIRLNGRIKLTPLLCNQFTQFLLVAGRIDLFTVAAQTMRYLLELFRFQPALLLLLRHQPVFYLQRQ